MSDDAVMPVGKVLYLRDELTYALESSIEEIAEQIGYSRSQLNRFCNGSAAKLPVDLIRALMVICRNKRTMSGKRITAEWLKSSWIEANKAHR